MLIKQKIVLVTSGQPALNPRLVKEADALCDNGYDVLVIYSYWNEWGDKFTKQLLTKKKWKAINAGGHPIESPVNYYLSKVLYKTAKWFFTNFSLCANFAVSRTGYSLLTEAKRHKADLYIGHNLGALRAVIAAAKKYNAKCGFDAEDFHRMEVNDDIQSFNYKIVKHIEDSYYKKLDYLSTSSPQTTEAYLKIYSSLKPVTVVNMFPKTREIVQTSYSGMPLKLFWFSQTIGPNRGLERAIEAIGLTKSAIELHLLGKPAEGFKQLLLQLAQTVGISSERIFFYEPVEPDEIFEFAAQFDVGLASETGFSTNNSMALSNKIFTYVQSGLAVAASNTPAQIKFINQYSETGKIYKNASELSVILNRYNDDRELLHQTKNASFSIGQTQINWETESRKFLNVVEKILNKVEL